MVLLSAAYEDFALIWVFDGVDCSVGGRLRGHNAQITAINMLQDTPLVITADEIVRIVWNDSDRALLRLGISGALIVCKPFTLKGMILG